MYKYLFGGFPHCYWFQHIFEKLGVLVISEYLKCSNEAWTFFSEKINTMICKFPSQIPSNTPEAAKDAHVEFEVSALMGDSLIIFVGCWCPEGFEFVCFSIGRWEGCWFYVAEPVCGNCLKPKESWAVDWCQPMWHSLNCRDLLWHFNERLCKSGTKTKVFSKYIFKRVSEDKECLLLLESRSPRLTFALFSALTFSI